ncbi:tetratricopeptide repeat protein, partial [Alistipes communis]|uniref:tetratricopeptide repeat protein n=1 Tax=Alistipes communis TaxID=2585118 RepID=UPI003AF00F64
AKGYAADPKNTHMALWLGTCYCELKDYDKGMEILEKVAGMQGPKFEADAAEANRLLTLYTNNRVAELQTANDQDGIIAMADKMLEQNPANALAQKIRLQAYLTKKDYAKVIELGEAAAAAQPDETEKSDVYFILGAAYNAKEMKPQAIEALKKVTAGDNVAAAQKSVAELSK